MSHPLVDRIAEAVMYEGYILYPYRPSIKNHQRWTFGGLFPEDYCQAAWSGDRSTIQTQCPVRGTLETCLTVRVRFLHLINRQVGVVDPPATQWRDEAPPPYQLAPSVLVAGVTHQAWQEAEEREIRLAPVRLRTMTAGQFHHEFTFPRLRCIELLYEPSGEIAGVLIREQEAVAGAIDLETEQIRPEVFRLTVRVSCKSELNQPATAITRDNAALRSLVSTHVILTISEGEFASLSDPPEWGRDAAASCRNVGTWPVLFGEEGETHTILSAPIILPDYPQIAPESAGDYFDGTEIDEMLTLRILTLTDDEKQSMARVDPLAHALLARTEAMDGGARMGLHGILRSGWSPKEEG